MFVLLSKVKKAALVIRGSNKELPNLTIAVGFCEAKNISEFNDRNHLMLTSAFNFIIMYQKQSKHSFEQKSYYFFKVVIQFCCQRTTLSILK